LSAATGLLKSRRFTASKEHAIFETRRSVVLPIVSSSSVAELEERGTRKLACVCRLVRDPGYDTAEYAVLIGDPWQGQGLGRQLTEFAIEIARRWDVRSIVAITDRSNNRMPATFRHFGFSLADDADEGVVRVTKPIEPKRT
jgi:acetyltransferase